MKNRILTFGIILVSALAAVSCVKNDVPKGERGDGEGMFRLSKIDFSEAVEILHNNTRAGVSADDFNVCVTRSDDGANYYLDCKYCDMPESLTLPVGEYRIAVTSHDVRAAEWDKPYYAVSEFFVIEKNKTTEIGELVCKLANIMVSVSFTGPSLDLLGDDAVISVRIGSAWLYYGLATDRTDAPYSPANYRYYEGSRGFFKAKDVTVDSPEYDMLYWEFSGDLEGEFFEDSGTLANVKAGEHHKMTFDITRTPVPGEEEGDVTFIFKVIATVESFDLNLNVDITEEYIGELEQAVEFSSTHSFSTRNTLTANGSMTGGEVTIPVGVTLEAVKGFKNVFIEFSTDNGDLAAELAAKGLNGTVDLAHPGAAASELTLLGLPEEASVVDKTLLAIDLRGLIKLAFDCGGANEFDIRITAYDNANEMSMRTLRFKLTDDSGPANISIEWVGWDIRQQRTITGSTDLEEEGEELVSKIPIVIKVDAPEGIASLIVEIISDNPLFGVGVLRGIGLDKSFDLVAPHDVGYEIPMDQVLGSFGFPVCDEVKDKTELEFDITLFVPLIYQVSNATYDKVEFKLTVVDNTGGAKSESIMLKIVKDVEY